MQDAELETRVAIENAEKYTLSVITERPRADITEVAIAAISAFDSMHKKDVAAKIGCARAVETYLRLIVRVEPDGRLTTRGPGVPTDGINASALADPYAPLGEKLDQATGKPRTKN